MRFALRSIEVPDLGKTRPQNDECAGSNSNSWLPPRSLSFLFSLSYLSPSIVQRSHGSQSVKHHSEHDPHRIHRSLPSMADEAKPSRAPGARPDRVRLVVLLYRQKGLSIEEFQAAWYVLRSPLYHLGTEV